MVVIFPMAKLVTEMCLSLYIEVAPVKHDGLQLLYSQYLIHYYILQAGVFMGFSITSAVLGGQMIIAYSLTIAHASYSEYYYGYSYELVRGYKYQRYSYDAKMALAAVILILGIVEFGIGIWVSICLCLMKPCCTDSQVS